MAGRRKAKDGGGPTPESIKKEKNKARELRRTQWWRNRIAEGRCHYCGRQVDPAELTLDHIVPLARGGRSTKANCVPCCKECNTLKKTDTPVDLILSGKWKPGALE